LPDAGCACTRECAILERGLDERQQGNIGRKTLVGEDFLEGIEITARPNYSIAEAFFDSKLRVDVFS
jgi:hypothetical protein